MKKIITVLMIAMLLCMPSVYGEEREIYIGDILTIHVASTEYTKAEMKAFFSDFEVIEIERKEEGYTLSLRTFETGIKKIVIGNQDLEIHVSSTLEKIDRDDIFTGDMLPREAGIYTYWNYILYMLIGIFLLSVFFLLRKKKEVTLSPLERFEMAMGALSNDDSSDLVKMNIYFKLYMEEVFEIIIRGKTSFELIEEIKLLDASLDIKKLSHWLIECDYYKFGKVEADKDTLNELSSNLQAIVREVKIIEEVVA